MSDVLLAPTSAGEILDKITILRIKVCRINDPDKLRNIDAELNALEALPIVKTGAIADLTRRLIEVNIALWDVEDALRVHEKNQDFGEFFVERARSVYRLNDRRAAIKREINALLNSSLVEEKSYG